MQLSDQRRPALAADASRVTIRLLAPGDSIADLTRLLHRAYAKLADLGFRFVACDQSDDRTRQRVEGAECYVAVAGDTSIVGTVVFRRPGTATVIPASPAWYRRPDVAKVNQFAVDPAWQGRGIGSRLLDHVERRAASMGAAEIALDTADGATHLTELYTRRGYRLVDRVQWPDLAYRSVVMSKRVAPDDGTQQGFSGAPPRP